jgi:hypothetical protein
MLALLNPPRGSSAYAIYSRMDEGAPTPALRPPTAEEISEIEEIRLLQTRIHKLLGTRQTPSGDDMEAVVSQFEANREDMLRKVGLAVNSMDRGIQA